MNKLTTAISILAVSTGMMCAQTAGKTSDTKTATTSVADELKQIENDWNAAAKAKDATKLGDILSDSWVGLSSEGKKLDKAKSLADLKKPGNTLDSVEMGPMTVRVYGNTAVVIGSDTEKSTEDGKDTSGKYVWMDVFVKENGKWRAVASESTKVK